MSIAPFDADIIYRVPLPENAVAKRLLIEHLQAVSPYPDSAGTLVFKGLTAHSVDDRGDEP